MEVSSVSHCPIVSDAWPQAELKSMSWDKLTGLADRQHLLYHLQNRLDSGLLPVSVMLFNIDDFRTINWRVGHRVGDRFLCAIARRLQARRSSQCRVGRFGADEFLLIKQDTSLDADQVFTRAREIASALSKPVAVAGQVLSRAVSTGASSSHGRQVDAESLVSEAELQLRRARQSARHLPKQRLRNNADTLDLERAIEAGKQIEVHYQPEVNLHTGKVAGVEA
ncbi:MAG: diguanylate cyclase domain-containing protein, partial [Granulosicoccaceae bacterium]